MKRQLEADVISYAFSGKRLFKLNLIVQTFQSRAATTAVFVQRQRNVCRTRNEALFVFLSKSKNLKLALERHQTSWYLLKPRMFVEIITAARRDTFLTELMSIVKVGLYVLNNILYRTLLKWFVQLVWWLWKHILQFSVVV